MTLQTDVILAGVTKTRLVIADTVTNPSAASIVLRSYVVTSLRRTYHLFLVLTLYAPHVRPNWTPVCTLQMDVRHVQRCSTSSRLTLTLTLTLRTSHGLAVPSTIALW